MPSHLAARVCLIDSRCQLALRHLQQPPQALRCQGSGVAALLGGGQGRQQLALVQLEGADLRGLGQAGERDRCISDNELRRW